MQFLQTITKSNKFEKRDSLTEIEKVNIKNSLIIESMKMNEIELLKERIQRGELKIKISSKP